jgi:hypothetical protein
MAERSKPEGKARETRRGGRKGSPPARNLRLGARGARATPRARAGNERAVTQEATGAAAPRDQRRSKRPPAR